LLFKVERFVKIFKNGYRLCPLHARNRHILVIGGLMSAALKNKTILVVDDDADTRAVLRSALEQASATVVEAHSVDAAFATYREYPPHAVITDIRLGRSDGYALIKAIRDTDKEYRGFTPVIAVTGFASPDDEARAMESGFNAFIAKPFDPFLVVAAIVELMNRPNDIAA
jgi:CheY-like chemotaxis protein